MSSPSIYKTLFDNAKEGFVVTNEKGIIEIVNPQFLELFGYSSLEEVKGSPIEIVIPKQLRNKHEGHKSSYVKNPHPRAMGIGMNLKGERKDGSEIPVEVSLTHFHEDGALKILCLITDITVKKQIEDEIRQLNAELEEKVKIRTQEVQRSHALYSQIARNFPKGTINVFDKDLNYVFVDGKELFKMGIDGKQLIGSNYIKRLSKEIAPTIEAKLKNVFNGDSKTFEIELANEIYEMNAEPLYEDGGEINQILVVERNITEEKKAEKEIKRALEREKELNELKSRFVSMASHEFRTPLSSIYSSATLLEKYKTTEQQEKRDKHINRIKSSVNGLTSILNDILTLSKMEEGKIEVQNEQFSIDEFCTEVCEEVQTIARRDQKIHCEHFGVSIVNTDRKLLKNIALNLLSNAIKYSYDGGNIYVNISVENDKLLLEVTDYGIGIPESEQSKMFERFFRAANVFNIEGTGLGLNIVKKYVELLNGNISFVSVPEKETKFTVEITLKP